MKKVLIYQSYYIPWRGYFDMINMADEFIIFDSMQIAKGFYNRNQIKTPNGKIWLTIPLQKKNYQNTHLQINNTLVMNQYWRDTHWKSFKSFYSKAPYFKEYKNIFEEIYLKDENNLSKINSDFIFAVCKILGINTKITYDTDYEIIDGKNERLISLVKQAGGNIYVSSPVAQNYMDIKAFNNAGIEIEWMNYDNYPEYSQLYPPFDPYVTILDLIFNEGPNASKFMKSMQ